MFRRFLGLSFLLLLPFVSLAEDKSKKAYELIYQDVQLLKQQLLALEQKIEKSREEIKLAKDQLEGLLAQFKLFQKEQSGLQEGLKKVPAQYQIILDRFEQLNIQLVKIYEDISALKGAFPPLKEEEQKSEKKQEEKKVEEQGKEKTQPSPQPSLSPKEVFDMAYSDYLKGSFALAIDGFTIYREQFTDSPLADDALYWIGECYFSQKKFEQAVNQFNDLILDYPQGDKVAAAYLKKGISLTELGKKEDALLVFKLLVFKYPLEEETKIAQQKIKDLTSK